MKTRFYLGVSALAVVCGACAATAPTPELQTARDAYSQARSSEAAQLNPRGVHEAFKALSAAESVHEDDPGSSRERHYAYIATRKSELAVAQASESLARKEQERAESDYRAGLEQRSEKMAAESTQYAEQLDQKQQELQANSQALEERERKLAEAQAEAERAQAELRQVEAMREEAGRLVISLSGVLFEAGGNQLSAQAQSRLDTVARALAAYPDRSIVVEGHTDDRGSDATNQQLSQKRADAVREYLAQRGVPADRMRSIGRGESTPIANNDTSEGRANNRRVEVIVEPAGPAMRHSSNAGEPANTRPDSTTSPSPTSPSPTSPSPTSPSPTSRGPAAGAAEPGANDPLPRAEPAPTGAARTGTNGRTSSR